MKKLGYFFIYLMLTIITNGQIQEKAFFNTSQFNTADPLRPWADATNHIRTAAIAGDMDKDGKPEILATEYANGGRVHVLEFATPNTLELVWSSPARTDVSSGSTPRWVRAGDLDGDGFGEIIFPQTDGTADGRINVYEWDGSTDNGYGTSTVIDFPADLFVSSGTGNFRTNREQGWVYDFDNDGRDELIMANRDNKVYILGINGDAPGFAAWQIEGGDPVAQPNNKFSAGSWWHSIPVDYDGDGVKEIVNHYWNFFGIWSIEPNGPDSYTYPSLPANPDQGVAGPIYYEYTKNINEDAVCYMGINATDVDGDGNEEVTGTIYIGSGDHNYEVVILDAGGSEATGVEVWKSQDQFAIIADSLWKQVGFDYGEYWGNGAADLNGNGKDEIILGGVPGNYITTLEYNGTGSIMDGANYTAKKFKVYDLLLVGVDKYDSLGTVREDTVWSNLEYFIAKMDAGDLTGDGKDELVLAYQSVPDSLTFNTFTWNGSAYDQTTKKEFNPNAINLRVVEATATGLKPINTGLITPDNYTIEQNYPNPFNPSTSIRFSLPLSKKISVKVYDMLGNEIKTLVDNQEFASGSYEVNWDGTNNFGQAVASGNYIAKYTFGNFSKSIKMSLLK
jgi:hypothetical protein